MLISIIILISVTVLIETFFRLQNKMKVQWKINIQSQIHKFKIDRLINRFIVSSICLFIFKWMNSYVNVLDLIALLFWHEISVLYFEIVILIKNTFARQKKDETKIIFMTNTKKFKKQVRETQSKKNVVGNELMNKK